MVFTPELADGFLQKFEWQVPQVSRTLLSILIDLNYVVVWIVFSRPPVSKSSCPCSNPLVTVPRAQLQLV